MGKCFQYKGNLCFVCGCYTTVLHALWIVESQSFKHTLTDFFKSLISQTKPVQEGGHNTEPHHLSNSLLPSFPEAHQSPEMQCWKADWFYICSQSHECEGCYSSCPYGREHVPLSKGKQNICCYARTCLKVITNANMDWIIWEVDI